MLPKAAVVHRANRSSGLGCYSAAKARSIGQCQFAGTLMEGSVVGLLAAARCSSIHRCSKEAELAGCGQWCSVCYATSFIAMLLPLCHRPCRVQVLLLAHGGCCGVAALLRQQLARVLNWPNRRMRRLPRTARDSCSKREVALPTAARQFECRLGPPKPAGPDPTDRPGPQ